MKKNPSPALQKRPQQPAGRAGNSRRHLLCGTHFHDSPRIGTLPNNHYLTQIPETLQSSLCAKKGHSRLAASRQDLGRGRLWPPHKRFSGESEGWHRQAHGGRGPTTLTLIRPAAVRNSLFEETGKLGTYPSVKWNNNTSKGESQRVEQAGKAIHREFAHLVSDAGKYRFVFSVAERVRIAGKRRVLPEPCQQRSNPCFCCRATWDESSALVLERVFGHIDRLVPANSAILQL